MTDPLTEMLASLKERLRAATPGKRVATDDDWPEIRQDDKLIAELGNHYGMETGDHVDEDAAYIAALDPDLVAAIIGCVEKAALAMAEIHAQKVAWPGEVDDLDDALAELRKLAEGRRG